MLIIGITGGSGCGKSSVSQVFKDNGFYIIDADKISRKVVEPGEKALSEIVEAFGKDILCEDGSLNRKKLGTIVFSDRKKLRLLNAITHKYILDEICNLIETNKNEYDKVVIDAAVMSENGIGDMCQYMIVVLSDKTTRIQRIMERDSLTHAQALQRIDAQESDTSYSMLADFILHNSGDMSELTKKANDIIAKIESEINQ